MKVTHDKFIVIRLDNMMQDIRIRIYLSDKFTLQRILISLMTNICFRHCFSQQSLCQFWQTLLPEIIDKFTVESVGMGVFYGIELTQVVREVTPPILRIEVTNEAESRHVAKNLFHSQSLKVLSVLPNEASDVKTAIAMFGMSR